MNRRGFLGSILAAAAAPAIVRADSLMRIVPTATTILEAGMVGEAALIAAIRKVWEAGGEPDLIQCSPAFAQELIGGFAGVAAQFRSTERALIGPAHVYISDYGCSRIVVERDIPRDFMVRSSAGFAHALL
jgi:hypothetical protein